MRQGLDGARRTACASKGRRVRSSLLGLLALVAVGAFTAFASADGASPMKVWMKSNMGAARASNDFQGLAKAFDAVASSLPDPGWSEWSAISKRGSAAAKSQDMNGVKEACNGCHTKFKDAYKARFSTRPAP